MLNYFVKKEGRTIRSNVKKINASEEDIYRELNEINDCIDQGKYDVVYSIKAGASKPDINRLKEFGIS